MGRSRAKPFVPSAKQCRPAPESSVDQSQVSADIARWSRAKPFAPSAKERRPAPGQCVKNANLVLEALPAIEAENFNVEHRTPASGLPRARCEGRKYVDSALPAQPECRRWMPRARKTQCLSVLKRSSRRDANAKRCAVCRRGSVLP